MNKKIKIFVSGSTNSGKSTIARFLTEQLTSGGFDVKNVDRDAIEMPIESDVQAQRMCALLDHTFDGELKIEVDTEYLLRSGARPKHFNIEVDDPREGDVFLYKNGKMTLVR